MRAAFADDLGMPAAVVIVNELDHSADVPDAEKYALLASWDRVLGLDLEREARSTWEPTAEMWELMSRRDEARAGKDYAASDALRDQLGALGVEVMDTPEGTRVRPARGLRRRLDRDEVERLADRARRLPSRPSRDSACPRGPATPRSWRPCRGPAIPSGSLNR